MKNKINNTFLYDIKHNYFSTIHSILMKCKPKIIMELNTDDQIGFYAILGFFNKNQL